MKINKLIDSMRQGDVNTAKEIIDSAQKEIICQRKKIKKTLVKDTTSSGSFHPPGPLTADKASWFFVTKSIIDNTDAQFGAMSL